MSKPEKPIDLAEKRQEARGDHLDRLPLRLRRIVAQAMREGFAGPYDDPEDGPMAA